MALADALHTVPKENITRTEKSNAYHHSMSAKKSTHKEKVSRKW